MAEEWVHSESTGGRLWMTEMFHPLLGYDRVCVRSPPLVITEGRRRSVMAALLGCFSRGESSSLIKVLSPSSSSRFRDTIMLAGEFKTHPWLRVQRPTRRVIPWLGGGVSSFE